LEFRSTSVSEKKIDSAQGLEGYWASQGVKDRECKGRLYLIEDLSAAYIEVLGNHFSIDPHFFVRHLYLPIWSKGEPNHILPRLPSRLISTIRLSPESYSLRYHELRSVVSNIMRSDCQKTTCANVRRSILQIGAGDDSNYDATLRNASFWTPRSWSDSWSGKYLSTAECCC
jgi:hypothetical protein